MYQRQVRGRCPICGAEHAACGPAAPVNPITSGEEVVYVQGGPLSEYDVEVNGVKLRLRLSEAEARKRGLITDEPAATTKAKPKSKARRVKNKKVDIEDTASGGE